ncbi:hypothetical protein, partial [Georgenia sp.]
WDALARGARRDDLYADIKPLTASDIATTDAGLQPAERLAAWRDRAAAGVERARGALDAIEQLEEPGLAALSVTLGYLRTLARSSTAAG